jgi:hypothetical protein
LNSEITGTGSRLIGSKAPREQHQERYFGPEGGSCQGLRDVRSVRAGPAGQPGYGAFPGRLDRISRKKPGQVESDANRTLRHTEDECPIDGIDMCCRKVYRKESRARNVVDRRQIENYAAGAPCYQITKRGRQRLGGRVAEPARKLDYNDAVALLPTDP